MKHYIALFHASAGGGWGVSFPDMPGCISAGDDFATAAEQAAQALRFHVEGLIEAGASVSAPRTLEALHDDSVFADDFADALVGLVPLLPPRARPMRVNISLDSNLLLEIDATAESLGMNRSEFLAEGARRFIVMPTADGWAVRREGSKLTRVYKDQAQATDAARKLAEGDRVRFRPAGRMVETPATPPKRGQSDTSTASRVMTRKGRPGQRTIRISRKQT